MNKLQRADDASLYVVLCIMRCERTLTLCDEITKSLRKRLDTANTKYTFNF
jgi:hypothetical protein